MDLRRLDHMPLIKAVMTPFPHTVGLDEPVTHAEAIMREYGVRHVPVEEHGRLVGVATDGDIGLLVNRALDLAHRERIRVRQVCVREPFVVDLNAPLAGVLTAMADRHIGSALVVRKDKLVGIFTMTDACRVLASILQTRFGRDDDDAA